MTNEEQLDVFYSFLSKNYKDVVKKYKQMCFLQHLTFNEDTLQDTIIKVADIITKKGLKGKTEKDIENYFFNSFRFNLYQEHLQEGKRKKDDNINVYLLEIEDTQYDESVKQESDIATHYLFNKIKEEFDATTVAIWRLRYMLTINRRTFEL